MSDDPLPITVIPGQGVFCVHCLRSLQATPYVKGVLHRMIVVHPSKAEYELDSDEELQWCPNNGRQWIVELWPPKVYPVDPATGGIDEMGGRL